MNLKEFISNFLSRSGAKVFNAMFLAKVIGFLVSYAMARILTQESYGDFTYAFTAVSFLVPFLGFGAYQSLVYFGARLKTEEEKKELFLYSFRHGMAFSCILTVLLILCASLITVNRPSSYFLLLILSFHLISFSLVEFVRNYTRLVNKNDLYAQSENFYTILLLFSSVPAAYYLNAKGYAYAMALVPLVIGVFYLHKLDLLGVKNKKKFSPPANFWRYGIFVSLGAVAAKMMYIVDIITIGNVLGTAHFLKVPAHFDLALYISEQTAIYKVCSIIPIATFVLPLALITTDFVKVSENSLNKIFLQQYALNTMKFLFPVSIITALFFHFSSEWILWLFGSEYLGNGRLISIFSLAIIGAFTFRIPFGNILSAVGKANWNAYISFGVLAINVGLNYVMVQRYGIIGAAWATTLLIWLSGLVSYTAFRWYLSSLTTDKII